MDVYSNQQPIGGSSPDRRGPIMVPPLPIGYPVKDEQLEGVAHPIETRSKGDGFWKGCCAGLCCCCALDMCF